MIAGETFTIIVLTVIILFNFESKNIIHWLILVRRSIINTFNYNFILLYPFLQIGFK